MNGLPWQNRVFEQARTPVSTDLGGFPVDRITEQLSQLQELTNEELSELEENALNEFSTTDAQERTSQSVAQLTQLADAIEAVRAEQSRRATEASALNDAAAEAAARVRGPEASVEDNTEEASIETPAGSENSLEDVVEEAEDEEDEEEDDETEVVVASSEAEAATEQPEGSEAAVEEAVVEEPAEAEAAVEDEPVVEEVAEAASEELAVEEEPEAEASVEEENQETTTEATVTAAANGSEDLVIEAPADRQPQVKPATTLTITAGADVPGFTAGTKFKDTLEVADAFQRRLHSLRHVHGGDGEQHVVASFAQEFPDERFLSPNDPLENTNKIQDVTSAEAIVAAAGICLPLETKYDLGCDVGVTDRPVRDALARFGADRGGIRYFTAPTLDQSSPAFANATGFWRGDQSDPNSGTWHTYGPDRTTATSPADAKPCLEMNCVAENTAYVEAITLCLTFNNLTTRTFPELIKRQNELALVAHARVAENALLAQLEAGSTAITAQTQVVGATREILNFFEKAIAAYRFRHRMASNSPLRVIIPAWVQNLLRADLALQMPGDGLELFDIAESRVNGWFRSRGVNVTWHLDGVGPAAVDADGGGSGTDVVFEFPGTIEFALFAEGAWLYLDGGSLDIGVIRDSGLVATNQYKQFVETFEGLANVGCDSYWVTAEYVPTGQAASLVDTFS